MIITTTTIIIIIISAATAMTATHAGAKRSPELLWNGGDGGGVGCECMLGITPYLEMVFYLICLLPLSCQLH